MNNSFELIAALFPKEKAGSNYEAILLKVTIHLCDSK
jgi:hypothetical protein